MSAVIDPIASATPTFVLRFFLTQTCELRCRIIDVRSDASWVMKNEIDIRTLLSKLQSEK